MQIRPITQADDCAMAGIIRQVLTEYGANRPGFAWQDPELDQLTQAYQADDCCYYVAEYHGKLVGGAGIGPFSCKISHACELQKMYLLKNFRGLGGGQKLMATLLQEARSKGYLHCYLETLASMKEAAKLYRASGFTALEYPLGDSGHSGCDQWYWRDL